MGALNMQPTATLKLSLKSYQRFKKLKKSFFFKKEIALEL